MNFIGWTEVEIDQLAENMARFEADDIMSTGGPGIAQWIADDAYFGRVGYADMAPHELPEEIEDWIELEYIDLPIFASTDYALDDWWEDYPVLSAVLFYLARKEN